MAVWNVEKQSYETQETLFETGQPAHRSILHPKSTRRGLIKATTLSFSEMSSGGMFRPDRLTRELPIPSLKFSRSEAQLLDQVDVSVSLEHVVLVVDPLSIRWLQVR